MWQLNWLACVNLWTRVWLEGLSTSTMRWLLFVVVASVAGLQWTERRTAARRSAAVRPAAPHDEASSVCDRRSLALALGGLAAGASAAPAVAMGPESTWPLWPALPQFDFPSPPKPEEMDFTPYL